MIEIKRKKKSKLKGRYYTKLLKFQDWFVHFISGISHKIGTSTMHKYIENDLRLKLCKGSPNKWTIFSICRQLKRHLIDRRKELKKKKNNCSKQQIKWFKCFVFITYFDGIFFSLILFIWFLCVFFLFQIWIFGILASFVSMVIVEGSSIHNSIKFHEFD